MDFFTHLQKNLLKIISFLLIPFYVCFPAYNDYTFSVDADNLGTELSNPVSNVNIWDMNGTNIFTDLQINEKYDIGEFVEYVQLMQCTGGSYSRDLFRDPRNRNILDDYDFSRLIENCKGILEFGAKPHLKLGNVPMKYSSSPTAGGMSDNICPPDDYNVYYNYIKAIGDALVEEFGREEVLSWRFGVMTEYENSDWFMSPDGSPDSTAVAYCKLYDYTVAALQDSIGENVFVGAHSMTVTEGLWDESVFINHCANGTNYCTGKTGTRICFLSASFYDTRPGDYTKGKTLTETIQYLKDEAEKAGLKDLLFGIDEGRLLCGINSGTSGDQLFTRTVGYLYQAAYDARLYKQLIDVGGDYFSSWSYLSGGLFSGYPTVSYHVASNLAKFAGSERVATKMTRSGILPCPEIDAVSAYNEEENTLRIMAYNFKNDVEYNKEADLKFNISLPQFDGEEVTVKIYNINDDCNYFDEWLEDRETYGIGDDCFSWSPDDPEIESTVTLNDPAAREIYFNELRVKYEECSRLEAKVSTATVTNGKLTVSETVAPNGVVFIEIMK